MLGKHPAHWMCLELCFLADLGGRDAAPPAWGLATAPGTTHLYMQVPRRHPGMLTC